MSRARPTLPTPKPFPGRKKDYWRGAEAVDLDLAWAIAEYRRADIPILETLRALARART